MRISLPPNQVWGVGCRGRGGGGIIIRELESQVLNQPKQRCMPNKSFLKLSPNINE